MMYRLRHRPLLIIIALVLLIIGFVILLLVSQHIRNSRHREIPSFDIVLPDSKTVDNINGRNLVSPQGTSFYDYPDTIEGITITVSQQQIPESFKNDVNGSVEEMAKQFNATNKLELDDGKVAYIGTSAKGPQSVIFIKGELLILIKSEKNVPDSSWKKYINSLR